MGRIYETEPAHKESMLKSQNNCPMKYGAYYEGNIIVALVSLSQNNCPMKYGAYSLILAM